MRRNHALVLTMSCSLMFLAVGCGGDDKPADAGGQSPKSSATPTNTTPSPPGVAATQPSANAPSGSPSAVPSAGAQQPVTPRCTTKDVRLSVGGSEGAAGSTYVTLEMRNVGNHACRTAGFGGVSYVSGGNGTQVGAPADRDRAARSVPMVLLPNGHAQATLKEARAENFAAGKCRPARVDGLRVYPPNETRSTFVKAPGTGCQNPAVHLLTLSPYQPVK